MKSTPKSLARKYASLHHDLALVSGSLAVAVGAMFVLRRRNDSDAQGDLPESLRADEAREEALNQDEEWFRLAQEVADMGTWDIDLGDGSGTWSKSLRQLSGVSHDAPAAYESFLALVHPADRPHVERAVADAVERRIPYEQEFRVCRPDGETRWLLSRGRALYDTRGRAVRMTGVAMDITERRAGEDERARLEERLRHAHKLEALGRLAGGVAHDFNNLLLGIRGHGELALAELAQHEDASDDVREMIAGADRAAALTAQLLAFGRGQVLQPEIVDLKDVVTDSDKLLRRLIGEDIELETIARGVPTCVNADRSQLEQVIVNLAVNARDAMPDGGRLTLEVRTAEVSRDQGIDVAPGPVAVLAVSDTGAGMDAETQARIFEPFFTTKDDGTGLGLATVHGIVKQSGGSIWVYSEVGHGTTFKLYFPLVDDSAATPVPDRPAPRAEAEAGETILLIEDSAQVREIVRRMLESSGYRVLVAADGDEALALADQSGRIDLLLTDLVMPGLGGRAVAERLRELRPDTRVLYMSGYTGDVVMRRGVLDNGTAFLQKPFGAAELSARVRGLLDESREPVAS